MKTLDLYSEPFAKTGNMAAEGFKRLLGRPALGLTQTVIREAIQNVIDAGQPGVGPSVLVRVRTLTAAEKRALDSLILPQRPRGDSTRADLEKSLSKPLLKVLEICDFSTVGLSGPTRADTPHDGSEPLNFVNFVRNVGAQRDTHHGGGTYGYGKSSLYAMSRCATIVFDSQTQCAGRDVRRFMACHLGAAFDASRRRFTGRHWWGALDGRDSIEPATGGTARSLSSKLGMPERRADDGGTSILIIDPNLSESDDAAVGAEIVETILWNFWPRMTATTPRSRKVRVRVEIEGQEIVVPKPEQFPPLDLFAAAMADQRSGDDLIEIKSQRPIKLLGTLALRKGMRGERKGAATRSTSLIPLQSAHIALMRPVELVVKYLPGDAFPDPNFEWGGVFICSSEDDVEDAFALAEPPAHDDWMPDNLPKGPAKTFVNVALRELNEIARTYVAPSPSVARSSQQGPSLAATASKLGAFLDRVSSTGPGRAPKPIGKKTVARKGIFVSQPKFIGLQLDDAGVPLATFRAELVNDGSDDKLQLIAEPHLVVEGGSTGPDDLPVGFQPTIRRVAVNLISSAGPSVRVGRESGTVDILVSTNPRAAVGLKLHLKASATQ